MAVLTTMAADVGVSQGAAGQAVTLAAVFAGIAAPTVALIIGRLDRKLINLLLCVLVIVSNTAVAITSDYLVLLAARALLGISIGGFFALAGATVVRLVTMQDMGKGVGGLFLAVIQIGVALGAIAGGIAVDLVGTSAPLYVTATCAVLAALLIATQRAPDLVSPTPELASAPAK